MHDIRKVIADTSVLIAFEKLELLHLLCSLYEQILLTSSVLVDDLKSRKTAKKLGCRMSGTIGVLHRMQRQGLISSAYEEMSKLKNMGFRAAVFFE